MVAVKVSYLVASREFEKASFEAAGMAEWMEKQLAELKVGNWVV